MMRSSAAPARTIRSPEARSINWLRPEMMTLLLMLSAALCGTLLSPFFADAEFLLQSATYQVEFGIIAIVAALVIIGGEIDLSVGGVMALTACSFALLTEAGVAVQTAGLMALAGGALLGLVNGLLVTALQLPAIIVTLGSLALYRGLAQVIAGDRSLGSFPGWFSGIDLRTIGPFPASILIFMLISLFAGIVLARGSFGRRLYLIGTNPIAARHVGLKVERLKLLLFTLSGAVSAFAGLMAASRLGSVRYDLAAGGELQVVLIAMLGGVSIFGGRGSILGVFLAFWLLVIVQASMLVANIAINVQLAVLGTLLIVAIIATDWIRRISGAAPRGSHPPRAAAFLVKAILVGLLLALTFQFTVGSRAAGPLPLTIAYIPKNTGNPYFDAINAGFADGCRQVGCSLAIVAPSSGEATSQIPFITAQSQRGVDVIALSPNSPDALVPTLHRARERGAMIVTINSDMPGHEGDRHSAILPVDFSRVGPSQLELMGSMIGYAGEFAILSATTDAPDQNQWIADLRAELARNPRYARMRLVKIAYGDDDPQKSTTEAEALLMAYPRLRGIISPTTVGLAAAAQVVERAGAAQRVRVTGLGTPNQLRRFVKNGTVSAFQLWNPYNEGLLAANYIAGVRRGRLRGRPGESFEVPGIGRIRVGERNVIATQATLTTFDRTNIDTFDF